VAVLPLEYEFSVLRYGQHIYPVGVLKYIVFRVDAAVRKPYLVVPYCQPGAAEKVFAAEGFPFTFF
jgi:hypothetical protein